MLNCAHTFASLDDQLRILCLEVSRQCRLSRLLSTLEANSIVELLSADFSYLDRLQNVEDVVATSH